MNFSGGSGFDPACGLIHGFPAEPAFFLIQGLFWRSERNNKKK